MKKIIYLGLILSFSMMGVFIAFKLSNTSNLFERAGMYFLIIPTICNTCIKLCYKIITGKGERDDILFFSTVHTALCWTVYLIYITINLDFHFAFVILCIANTFIWGGLAFRWIRKKSKKFSNQDN